MNNKTVAVIMLPKADNYIALGSLFTDEKGKLDIASYEHGRIPKWIVQHLYFLSDEKIMAGQWLFDGTRIRQRNAGTVDSAFTLYKKIIASTNPSLGLPSIPENWIKDKYVPSNGSIKEVDIFIETTALVLPEKPTGKGWISTGGEAMCVSYERIKLTPNNEIVIVDEPIKKPEIADSIIFLCSYCDNKVNKRGEVCQNCIDQEIEEAAEKYLIEVNSPANNTSWHQFDIDIFKAGALWMKNKMNGSLNNTVN